MSFSEIVDGVYRALAVEYLKTTHMSVDDIGMLMGFNDVANFRKAFRRWTGQTPSEIRRDVQGNGSAQFGPQGGHPMPDRLARFQSSPDRQSQLFLNSLDVMQRRPQQSCGVAVVGSQRGPVWRVVTSRVQHFGGYRHLLAVLPLP